MNTQLNNLRRLLAEIDSLVGSAEVSGLIRDARSCAQKARSVTAKAITIVTALDAQQPAQAGRAPESLELTDELRNILGRPNFTCTHFAAALRRQGHSIERKSEAEQAACIHWMLNHYLAHGADWRTHAEAELKAAASAQGGE